jgi:hypothetical protein
MNQHNDESQSSPSAPATVLFILHDPLAGGHTVKLTSHHNHPCQKLITKPILSNTLNGTKPSSLLKTRPTRKRHRRRQTLPSCSSSTRGNANLLDRLGRRRFLRYRSSRSSHNPAHQHILLRRCLSSIITAAHAVETCLELAELVGGVGAWEGFRLGLGL